MIANARMYAVSAQATEIWRALLARLTAQAGLNVEVIEHAPPAPIDDLWRRTDMAAVFMCGLPYSCADPKPMVVAAPVPSPPEFAGLPKYWSELVVRSDGPCQDLEATFGGALCLTAPNSQSGYAAALQYLMAFDAARGGKAGRARSPLYREIIAPAVTPLGAVTAVLSGAADVAPIDAYAYRLMQKHCGDLTSKLRTVARTAPTPIPPLVASIEAASGNSADSRRLQAAFTAAHRDPTLNKLLAGLELSRFVAPDPRDYDALRINFESANAYWREHPLAEIVHPAFVR
ncbi:MAG TPA: PhnD/SsuA/transferrin family substrate-binding protein [Steroidobacteraceae bacterium]|nr:PhnD/SsuA/transferrin family substrate-binding protein [Steroidobacteraceae bacterium]